MRQPQSTNTDWDERSLCLQYLHSRMLSRIVQMENEERKKSWKDISLLCDYPNRRQRSWLLWDPKMFFLMLNVTLSLTLDENIIKWSSLMINFNGQMVIHCMHCSAPVTEIAIPSNHNFVQFPQHTLLKCAVISCI